MKFYLFGLLALFLSGCVTTSDSVFQKANKDKANENYVKLGLAYIQRNNFEKARININRALEIKPDSSEAYAALGLLYQQEAENVLAEKNFLKSMSIDENNSRGRNFYAAFLYHLGRYDEALVQFEQAGEDTEYSGRALIFLNIAQCNILLKRNDQAIKAYEKALALDRGQPQALMGIIQLLIDDQQYLKAQRYYNRVVNLISSSDKTHSAKSLWLGIAIARYYNNDSQETGYALLLEQLYPDSQENQQYRALKTNE